MVKRSDDNTNCDIRNTTKGKLPSLPFALIKNTILGKNYELSLVFVGDTRSRNLNRQYRQKDRPTNVLSFPLSESEGEIFLNLKKAKSEAKDFDKAFVPFVGFLFIHGLLHLKGMDHGDAMEKLEKKYCKQFGF